MANDERDGVGVDKANAGGADSDKASPGAVSPGFDTRLSALRHRYPVVLPVDKPMPPSHNAGEDAKLLGFALRVGVEFVSAVAIGSGLGFLADQALDSRPGGFIVGFFLGAMAGFLNVYRYATRMMGPVPVTEQEQVDGSGDGSEI